MKWENALGIVHWSKVTIQFRRLETNGKNDGIKLSPAVGTREFNVGDQVQSQNYSGKRKWNFGRVNRRFGRIFYEVKNDDGRIEKRHVDQLRSTLVPEGKTTTMSMAVTKPNCRPYYPRSCKNEAVNGLRSRDNVTTTKSSSSQSNQQSNTQL